MPPPPSGPVLDLDAARAAVRARVPPTPVLRVPALERGVGGPLFLKLDNLQRTGSFKVRGAAARMSALDEGERARGVVACSSGNHGRAVAFVARSMGIEAHVFVPSWVDPVKLEAIQELGARAVVRGDTYDEAAEAAHALARDSRRPFIHPFDDERVAAGQGTVALEIMEQIPDTGTVVVPLSGGGLAGGMAYALHARGREVRVVAASAHRARVMWESLRAGRPVELPEEPTVASALSGGIELDNRVTFELVRRYVDTHVVVEEAAIEGAMAWAWRSYRMGVEGGGAVGLAAVQTGLVEPDPRGKPTVVVVSGGNVGLETMARIVG
jgi:threonine dehydratase